MLASLVSLLTIAWADVPHCPDDPEDPRLFRLLDVLRNWSPNNVSVPPQRYSSLCRLDFRTDYAKALRYRQADVPFVLTHVPALDALVAKWTSPGYLAARLAGQAYRIDVSTSNWFQNYDLPLPANYTPPFEIAHMTFAEWRALVDATPHPAPHDTHYYFRFFGDESAVVRADVPLFWGDSWDELFMEGPTPPPPEHVRCRWGQPGHIAAAHYDARRNVAMTVTGRRRWILSPPEDCAALDIINMVGEDFPSYRHSRVDFRAPDLARFPLFAEARGVEEVLKPGEVLFIPSYWVHQVQILDEESLQVNGFSTVASTRGEEEIEACGMFETREDEEDEEDYEEWEEMDACEVDLGS